MNSGIAGSASNLSLLIIHFRLKERLLDPTGGAKISSELSHWKAFYSKMRLQSVLLIFVAAIFWLDIFAIADSYNEKLEVSGPIGHQLLAGVRTGLL